MAKPRVIPTLSRIILPCLLFVTAHLHSQVTVNSAVTAQTGVQTILLGDGVTVSNITFAGANEQIGSFNCNGPCNLGIGTGLVLGSGAISQVPGNNSGSSSATPASGWGFSDPDLVMLAGAGINDAAVLQFDFVPTGDTLRFDFVFGSDEYPEWVSAGYNDAFGFFLSGPGISGPYSNNSKNIALLPNGITPVTIDNVNAASNSQFYINNNFINNNQVECDGYTTVLTAFSLVQCGQTYHIKIAIGDAGDTGFDSFVFLKAGSFQSNQLTMNFTAPNLSPSTGGIYEGCDTAYLTFTRSSALSTQQTYQLAYSGTAVNGVDFELMPSSITFLAGESTVSLPITAIPDGVLEGTEVFTLTITGLSGCSSTNASIDIGISDLPELQVTMPDVMINCGQQALITPQIQGGLGNYQVYWPASNLTGPTLSAYPNVPTSYNFIVTDTCGVTPFNGLANVTYVTNPPIVVDAGPDITTTCLDQINITPTVSGGFGTYSYLWSGNGVQISTNANLQFTNSVNQTLVLTVTDQCNVTGTDQVLITYPPQPIAVDLGPDLTVTCVDQTTLSANISGGLGTYTYTWSGPSGNLGFGPQLIYQTPSNSTVVLQVNDQCGNSGTDQINLVVPQLNMATDIGQDLTITCIDAIPLQGVTSGGAGQYTHTWQFNGSTVGTGANYLLQTPTSGTLTYQVSDQCGNSTSDQINVQVPPVPLTVNLGQDLVVSCINQSPLTPSISGGIGSLTYNWSAEGANFSTQPWVSYQTTETTVVSLQVTDQCGNTGQDQVMIEVPDVPISITSTPDSTICKGNSITLNANATGGVGNLFYTWNGLENTSNSVTVAPGNSSSYTVTVADACGNNATKTINVIVYDIQPRFTAEYLDDDGMLFNNLSGSDLIFQWNFNDGTYSYEPNPIHYFTGSNDWLVTLTVSGATGCKKSVSQLYHPLGNLFIPNCFTPDNDGVNDFFFVKGHDLRQFELWIYNRNGEEIFHSTDINTPWDGSFKGNDHYVPNGVYPFRLVAIGKRENMIEKSGHILLMR